MKKNVQINLSKDYTQLKLAKFHNKDYIQMDNGPIKINISFNDTDIIKELIKYLQIIKHNMYYDKLNNDNDEYNYGHNI